VPTSQVELVPNRKGFRDRKSAEAALVSFRDVFRTEIFQLVPTSEPKQNHRLMSQACKTSRDMRHAIVAQQI
jgi:hypothetical protein